MQRPSIQSLARRYQIASELAKYGIHVERPRKLDLVTVDGRRPGRLMADGLPAWRSRLDSAHEATARFHAGDRS